MHLHESTATLSPGVRVMIDTRAMDDRGLALHTVADAARWEALFDRLIDWARRPEQFDDEAEAPSQTSISSTYQLLTHLRGQSWPAPTSLVSDANGGTATEFILGEFDLSFRVDEAGTAECLVFAKGKVTARYPIDLSAP